MKTDKKFDCVKMMRDIRDEVNEEIVNMNPEQILEYIKAGRNDFEKAIAKRPVEQVKGKQISRQKGLMH
jgi:hypothetical protein